MSSDGSLFPYPRRYTSSELQQAEGRIDPLLPDAWDGVLLGSSLAARQLRSQVQRIAPHFRVALIRGEAGSGKEHVARAIHALSDRVTGAFVISEAAALAEFRAERRSPMTRTPLSLLESASGGILYLQHVGNLSPGLQAALLRALHSMEERRVAVSYASYPGPERREADQRAPRVLVASDTDLRTLCAASEFRQDLYAYLSAIEIIVPPLRERVEDIPELAEWLLRRCASEAGVRAKLLAKETTAQLQRHPWSGNLRELEMVITQAAALAEGEIIEPRHLLTPIGHEEVHAAVLPQKKLLRLQDIIHGHVMDVLKLCHGNKLRTAELLGISRSTLYRMLEANSEDADDS
jgi:DNA-binding NtrC family response regulator